jgi:two-component system, OmpR family, phosphate regulon response regulator OmpR
VVVAANARVSGVNRVATDAGVPQGQCLAARALVAAEHATMRALLKNLLERSGMEVQKVDPRAALSQTVRQQRPDLVLLDLPMEPVSSLDALKRMRADGQQVPVIIVTDVAADLMLEAAVDAGADDYIRTPCSEAVLLAHVHAVLRRSQWQRG